MDLEDVRKLSKKERKRLQEEHKKITVDDLEVPEKTEEEIIKENPHIDPDNKYHSALGDRPYKLDKITNVPKGKKKMKSGQVLAIPYAELMEKPEGERRVLVAQTIAGIYKWFKAEPINKYSDEEFLQRTDEFFITCAKLGEHIFWEKYCLALGYGREEINKWQHGSLGKKRAEMLKLVKEFMASYDAEMVLSGNMHPTAYIFRSKNFYGMRDQVDHTVMTGEMIDVDSRAEIQKRLADAKDVTASETHQNDSQ